MYRGNIFLGTVVQLYQLKSEEKLGNIIFVKDFRGSLFKRQEYAVDCLSDRELVYFKDGPLSTYNYFRFVDYGMKEEIVVQHGYSLNKYLKEKGYPVFISLKEVRSILKKECEGILNDTNVVSNVIKNEKDHFLEVDTLTKKLSLW